MNRAMVFLIGLLVFAGAAGGLYYRLNSDPDSTRRYDWALEQLGVREAAKKESPAPGDGTAAPNERSFSKSNRADRNQQQDRLELFKLGLDLANVLVGLVGIYLALTSMSARRQT